MRDFCNVMHMIRNYGNMAAHNQVSLPGREECHAAVTKYLALKADYENSSSKA